MRSLKRGDVLTSHLIPAVIVFLMMMVLIGASWRTAVRTVSDVREDDINARANYAETNIIQKLRVNENALKAASGLMQGPNTVSRNQWKLFVDSLNIEERMPGIMGLGYIEYVSPEEISFYETRMRNSGIDGFEIRPAEPKRDIYASISYMEPVNERNRRAIGYDLYTQPKRQEAMHKARDSGNTSMTDVDELLQKDGKTISNGVTLFHPVYRSGSAPNSTDQRRANIVGYVYAPISSELLFKQIFYDKNPSFNFKIFDSESTNAEQVLYEELPEAFDEEYDWSREDVLNISDREWLIRFGSREDLIAASIRDRPRGVLIGGTIFAFVVAAVVYLLLQRRTKIVKSRQSKNIERAKDNLLSLASHQLRTPATGVKQYLGMALEGFTGTLKPEQQEVLARAYDSNERQLRIINEFLYLAKADADRVVISPRRFNLVSLTREIVDDMHSTILDSGHNVKFLNKSKSLIAYADTHSSRMIIENLLSNAIKYTPEGGNITIEIKKIGNETMLSIKDNGVGIDRKDFPKLFKQFSRIPNELTKQTTGTGIGLYLAHYLTKANGGRISVKSIKGEGSTFRIYFPRKKM